MRYTVGKGSVFSAFPPNDRSDQEHFDMRRRFEKFRVLIFALSILMTFCLAYSQNDRLGEIRILSPHLTLGSVGPAAQEGPVSDPPDQSKGTASASRLDLNDLGSPAFLDSALFSSPPFSFEQNISILRC